MLIAVCILIVLIHFIEMIFYSMRLVGARTKQIALAICFFNVFILGARMSNMLQAPLLGNLIDKAILLNSVNALWGNFRIILLFACFGNLLGAFFIPSTIKIFTHAINEFDNNKSIIRSIVKSCRFKYFVFPRFNISDYYPLRGVSMGFIWCNIFVVAIYTVGILSSLMAGALLPQYRVTAVQFASIINGFATVLLFLWIDPVAANVADDVARGKREEIDIKNIVFYLVLTRVIGTLIVAQLIFYPSVLFIKWIVECVFV